MMCASSRMVVKRRGADKPVVLPCTLLPYIEAFEMGPTLADAAKADGGMFDAGAVKLCHRHCAKFCVLGGGSCLLCGVFGGADGVNEAFAPVSKREWVCYKAWWNLHGIFVESHQIVTDSAGLLHHFAKGA